MISFVSNPCLSSAGSYPGACILSLIILLFAAASPPAAAQPAIPQDLLEDPHFREELGVNEFTVPSIRQIFEDLKKIEPIPYELVVREIPDVRSRDRTVIAISLGGLIADGFVYVQLQDEILIENLAREVLQYGDRLGVGDRLKPRAKSMLEKAFNNEWENLQEELAAAQAEVEHEMLQLRDEQLAHLISLGGWFRGLEIGAEAVLDAYDPTKAQVLIREDLLDYFMERVETLHPMLKEKALIIRIDNSLKGLKDLFATIKESGQAPSKEAVTQIEEIASDVNQAVVKAN